MAKQYLCWVTMLHQDCPYTWDEMDAMSRSDKEALHKRWIKKKRVEFTCEGVHRDLTARAAIADLLQENPEYQFVMNTTPAADGFSPEIVPDDDTAHADAVDTLNEVLDLVENDKDVTGVMIVIERKEGMEGTRLKASWSGDKRRRIGFLELLKMNLIADMLDLVDGSQLD